MRDCLGKIQRRKWMQLVNAQNQLQEEISLASCTEFKLVWGIAREFEPDFLYSFDYEEKQWAGNATKQEVTPHGKGTG